MKPQIAKEILKGKSLEASYFLIIMLQIYSSQTRMVLT